MSSSEKKFRKYIQEKSFRNYLPEKSSGKILRKNLEEKLEENSSGKSSVQVFSTWLKFKSKKGFDTAAARLVLFEFLQIYK